MDAQTPSASVTQNSKSPESQNLPQTNPTNNFKNFFLKNKYLFVAILSIIVVIAAWLIFQSQKSQPPPEAQTGDNFSPVDKPPTAIAKVGDEYIYQADLDIELANYPGVKNEETEKVLLEKLVKDSIVIQAADKEKILAINPAAYNTPGKDYGKRMADLKAIKELINQKTDHLSGTIVNVWFNNYEPAKMGLEAGKKLAFERISALQKRVAGKEITAEQAGNIIRSDPSYADLDVGYRVNASFSFSKKKGEKITFNPEFDQNLWNLEVGGVTDVYLGSIVSGFTDKPEESFYAFGQVTEKVDNGNNLDYEEWLKNNQAKYEVVYY